jgi:putative phosphoribosyl transferase
MDTRSMVFQDRTDAGRRLATRMAGYRSEPNLLILGLPRGGVAVAFEIAKALHAPLDIFVVRKLGVPGQEELAMGAIASGNVLVRNLSVLDALHISESVFRAVVERERDELKRREVVYRGHRAPPAISGRSIIVVDDGLATGATMQAAIEGVRTQKPARIVVAVPVAAPCTYEKLRGMVDDFIWLATPERFYGVSQLYKDFSETSDEEVHQLLEEAQERRLATTKG